VALAPLANAVERLCEGLMRHQLQAADDLLLDGLIQRFEYTYELCHQMLRRYLREASASPGEIDRMAFQDLIRTATQQGLLLGDWPAWHRYRDLRARSSHTYRAETANAVVEAIPGFLAEAEHFRNQLRARLV